MDHLEKESIKEFNQWAQYYDRTNWVFVSTNRVLMKTIEPKPGSSVLDVGCGTGILLDQLSHLNRNLKLYGLDISPEMVKKSKTKLGKSAEIILGSVSNIPLKMDTFDFVTCSMSFHHHSDSSRSLKEMHRVLRPGGTLTILDVYSNGILRKMILSILNLVTNERDTHIYTSEQMRQFLVRAGFHSITQQQISYYKLITQGKK
jgi:ubiquinone/menaquinone biosynthesis C-methylase UbiE